MRPGKKNVPRNQKTRAPRTVPGSPFLTRVSLNEGRIQAGIHPFTIPLLKHKFDLALATPVTFLVGENGSGKSTLLEGLAWALGFNAQGGNKDNSYAEGADGSLCSRIAMRLLMKRQPRLRTMRR